MPDVPAVNFVIPCCALQIEGDNEPQPSIPREDGQVPFVFIGTTESICNAIILLEYHLTHLKVGHRTNI